MSGSRLADSEKRNRFSAKKIHYEMKLCIFLQQILEQGPTQFQQPVLNMICAILKYSDASSPGLKQFHGHLLKVVTAHVKVSLLYETSFISLSLPRKYFPNEFNRNIFELSPQSIHKTGCFDKVTINLATRHSSTKSIFVNSNAVRSRSFIPLFDAFPFNFKS